MEIKIGTKTYTLKFGTRFVREIDKLRAANINGVKFGMGVSLTLPSLKVYDTAALADVLYAAAINKFNTAIPSLEDVEDLIDELDEKDQVKLFADVQKEIQVSNATKLATKNMRA